MGRGKVDLSGKIGVLRARIVDWRASKVSPVERMPEGMWAEATVLAGEFGACAVSRALGIGYGGLRKRLGEVAASQVGSGATAGGFVELGTWAGCGPMRVEVDRVDGCRMRLDVTRGTAGDALALLRAFLGQAV